MKEQIEKAREFWAKVAKDNGWYQEPFYVQVWVDPTTGLVSDSVSSRDMTQDHIVMLKSDLCSYCGDENVFEHYEESCWQCVFTCERCEQTTPYEKGMAYDELCDDCGVLVGSTPENPWKGENHV